MIKCVFTLLGYFLDMYLLLARGIFETHIEIRSNILTAYSYAIEQVDSIAFSLNADIQLILQLQQTLA